MTAGGGGGGRRGLKFQSRLRIAIKKGKKRLPDGFTCGGMNSILWKGGKREKAFRPPQLNRGEGEEKEKEGGKSAPKCDRGISVAHVFEADGTGFRWKGREGENDFEAEAIVQEGEKAIWNSPKTPVRHPPPGDKKTKFFFFFSRKGKGGEEITKPATIV